MQPEVVINGTTYVPKGLPAESLEGMEYKIVRSYSAGVFAGYIEKREGKEVHIRNARRLWKWVGAASPSRWIG